MELRDYIDLLEWPAMLVTVAAAWMIGSLRPNRRIVGFSLFLLSNLLWVIWGVPAGAWGLIVLQLCLAVMNIRGLWKNEHTGEDGESTEPPAAAAPPRR